MRTDLEKYRIEMLEFANNTSTRVPICLLIDTSMSMRQEQRINKINNGIKKFIEDMNNDAYASTSVELCIITFGGTVKEILPFTEIRKAKFEDLNPNGSTPLGAASERAINAIKNRLNMYDNIGINSYNPWLIIFSDGIADDDSYKSCAKELCKLQLENRWKVMTIALGDEPNSLIDFTPKKRVYGLKDVNVSDFFDWISQSVASLSRSIPDISDYDEEELRFKGQLL